MNTMLVGSIAGTLLGWLMGFLSLFLIMLILIQRGKGGGLTGALGGPGGQSAFGSKAGDTFTVITVVVASIWAFTCAFTMWLLGSHAPTTSITETNVKAGPGDTQPADDSAIPPIGSDPVSGLGQGGIGALSGEDQAADADNATENIELTPAETNASEAAESSAEPTDATPENGESTAESDETSAGEETPE